VGESLSPAGDLDAAAAAAAAVAPASLPVSRPGFASVLHNRYFVLIWIAQIASQTAQNSLWFALLILVGGQTGRSPASVGLTIVLVQLPTVLFSSISGVLVDRVSKQAVLVGTNAIRVVGVILYLLFETHVAGLYLVTFFVATVSQPFAPAEGSTLPILVDREELIAANSLFQTTFMASQALGFAVAPIAIGLLGMHITLFVIAGLFALAAVVLLPLPAETRVRNPSGSVGLREIVQRILKDLREVGVFIVRDPPLARALFQIALAPTLLLVLAEVGQDYLTRTLGIGATSTALFFLLAPAGAGLAIGLAILGHWGYALRKDRLVLVALIALGFTVIGLASVPTIALMWRGIAQLGWQVPSGVQYILTMVPFTALMGIEVAFINAPVQTIVQQRAKPELRGRVLALQQTITAGMAIPPLVLIGGFAALVGTPATLSVVGVVLVLIGLVYVYYS
jgi:MFS family permease